MPPSLKTIGAQAFDGCGSLRTIVVRVGDVERVRKLIADSGFASVGSLKFEQTGLVYYEGGDGNITIDGRNEEMLPVLNMPEEYDGYTVNAIGRYAFYADGTIEEISIPRTVSRFEEWSFEGCKKLKSVSIRSGERNLTIDYQAFLNCSALETIFLPSRVAKIYNNAFDGCTSLKTVYVDIGDAGRVRAMVEHGGADIAKIAFVEIEQELTVPGDCTGGSPITVKTGWFAKYPEFRALFGSNLSLALRRLSGKKGPDGRELYVWEDYVAGTDPTDSGSVFAVTIAFEGGKPIIGWSPELPQDEANLRKYTIFGKERLSDCEWAEVTDGNEHKYSFFRATVKMK